MKILMVTPYYFPVIGGTESSIKNLSAKLNEIGVPTDVMTFNFTRVRAKALIPFWREKTEEINGVKVIKIPAFNLLPWPMHSDKINFMINLIPGRFANHLKNYDIIHFHNDVDLSFPFFSYLVDKPKIFHCHLLSTTHNFYRRNFISRRIFRNVADIYIAVSKYVVKLFVDLGIPRTKVRLLPNGIDVNRFRPNRESKIENLLLFVGRLDPYKGLHFLLKSLGYLEKPVQLVIIGPLVRYRAYNKKILTLIREINEKTIHKVMYMGAQKPNKIIEWYQKASIFVLPSLSESFGIVNLEALSCKTPVIASNVGGIPEVVRDHKNGILVPPGNVAKLAQGIQYLLDNDEIRKKFGEEGRKLVVKDFSSEILMKRLLQIYKEMIP